MPENAPTPPPAGPAPGVSEPAPSGGMKFDIGEEFGTAKRNLPPAKIVLIGIAVVLVVGAILVFTQSLPSSAGSIDDVVGVEVPNQGTVLAAINVTVRNGGKKAMWIHSMKATLKTDSGEFPDEAASPVDFERYFQALPALKQHAMEPLKVETKIQPGGEVNGTIMVSFPVTQDGFDSVEGGNAGGGTSRLQSRRYIDILTPRAERSAVLGFPRRPACPGLRPRGVRL